MHKSAVNEKEGAALKTHRWRYKLGFAAMAVMIAVVTGCSGTGSEKVTVKNPPVRETGGKVELERIDRQSDSYGLAWLSDSEIISTKSPKWMEGDLYVHSLVKEKDPDRKLGVQHALTVNPSPQQSYLFISNRMGASFLNLADGKETPLDVSDGTYSVLNGDVRGAWVEEKAYVFAAAYGLGVAGTGGNVTPILKMKDQQSVMKVEAFSDSSDPNRFTVYFLDSSDTLYKLRVANGQFNRPTAEADPELVRKKIADFSISPDGTNLALVEETGDNKNTVYFIPAGKPGKETKLAEGRLARQMSWSPDGSKLAYSLFNLERGGSGLYVMDTMTGHMTLVSLYPNLQSLLVWSPDGNQLMMSQENPEMNLTTTHTKLMTEIYRFK